MKIIIGIILALGLLFVYLNKKKTNSSGLNLAFQKPQRLYSLNDGNQNKLIISAGTTKEWLESIQSKYNWNEFDEYDNRLWEYMYELFDKPVEKQTNADYWTIWKKLTREQKVFWAFLAFTGDTDNGGINQFIFNRPEFIIAVAQMWNELGLEKIASDYESFLIELSGKPGNLNEIKYNFTDNPNIWKKVVSPFANEKIKFESVERIEDYFYDKEFRKVIYKKVADYIEENIDQFTTLN